MNQLALHSQPTRSIGVLPDLVGITSQGTTPLMVMNSHNATNKQQNKGNNMGNDMDTVVLTTQGEQSAKIEDMDYEVIPVDIDFKAMIPTPCILLTPTLHHRLMDSRYKNLKIL